MKREVTTCDESGCRKLADTICILCSADYCFEHIPVRLVLKFGTASPKQVQNITQPAFPEYEEGTTHAICHKCNTFFSATAPDAGIHGAQRATLQNAARAFTGRLDRLYGQLVEDVQAMKAAHALGSRGEALLKVAAPDAAASAKPTKPHVFFLRKEDPASTLAGYWELSPDLAPPARGYDAHWPNLPLPHGWAPGTYIANHAGVAHNVTAAVVISREDGLAVVPAYLRDRYRAIAEGRL